MSEHRTTNEWRPITHLVYIGMSNSNGLLWKLYVGKYLDETRKSVRGMNIGHIDADGFHTNERDSDRIYMMKFTSDGEVMFFEKNKHIQELQDSLNKDKKI